MSLLMVMAYIFVYIGMISALVILVDIFKNPQPMKIMNIVWVVNGFYLGPFGIWAYWVMGRVNKKILRCIGRSLCGKVFLFPLAIVQEDVMLSVFQLFS